MEIWKDVLGYKGLYQVSNLGRVKSFKYGKERILKQSLNYYGYYVIGLSKNGKPKIRTVHQLVAESFLNHIPCGHKLVPNHINFDKQDNRVVNIEIVTQRKNSNQAHIKSSSKYTGVSWYKRSKKWISKIRIKGNDKYLGSFTNELEASTAYQKELLIINKQQ